MPRMPVHREPTTKARKMAEASIPVDLLNPGQVFACLGLVEAADVLLGDARGGFDWSDESSPRFRVSVSGVEDPVKTVLRFLGRAKVISIAPSGSDNETAKWKVDTVRLRQGDPFPFSDPSSPATLPARLVADGRSVVIDHWGDETTRDNVKFWAGSGGYPGVALARDALDLVRDRIESSFENPFGLSVPQSSSFRFDWRRDYVPMDAGFSPNEHGKVAMLGFPLVELLAAIGLENARPLRLTKLEYRYAVVANGAAQELLDPILLRASLGCAAMPFPQRFFRMRLAWPGQENQARCIVDVIEELNHA